MTFLSRTPGCAYLLLACLLLSSCARPALKTSRKAHRLGQSKVVLVASSSKLPGPTLFSMHDDENTAVVAARTLIVESGGRVVELSHGGSRLIAFRLDSSTFLFDPNRIFTDAGARDSLERYSSFSKSSFSAVRSFAEELLNSHGLLDQPLIITLHNNSEEGYSALSYLVGAELERDASRVFLNDSLDPDDFFFVTREDLYECFMRRGFNVVLQNNDSATDDGSLSVLAASLGRPYVNVEAQHGHVNQQIEMIRAALEAARDYSE